MLNKIQVKNKHIIHKKQLFKKRILKVSKL